LVEILKNITISYILDSCQKNTKKVWHFGTRLVLVIFAKKQQFSVALPTP